MKGFPTSFHLGPLVFHTYGFGLAIAAYVAYLYARHRLKKRGIDLEPFGWFTFWILVSRARWRASGQHRHQLGLLPRSPRPLDRRLAGRTREFRRHRPRARRRA